MDISRWQSAWRATTGNGSKKQYAPWKGAGEKGAIDTPQLRSGVEYDERFLW
jgi:hypothetical protein